MVKKQKFCKNCDYFERITKSLGHCKKLEIIVYKPKTTSCLNFKKENK